MISREYLDKLNEINRDAIVRKDLGPFSFMEVGDTLSSSVDLIKFISDEKNPVLSDSLYTDIENSIKTLLVLVDRINNFNPKSEGNAANEHVNIISEIKNFYNSHFKQFYSLKTYLVLERGDFNVVKDELQKTKEAFDEKLLESQEKVKSIDVLINNTRIEAKSTKEEINKILEDTKKFSVKDVVTKYEKIFDDQANEHKEKIKKWWILVILSIFIEILLAVAMLCVYSKYFLNSSVGLEISLSVAFIKLFILSAGAILVNQVIKNLNAQNHLYTLNKFKANALASFEAFLNSTDDAQVKDALLIQISKSIYDFNISGYLSKDDSPSNFTNVDVIKRFIDGKQ